MADPKNRPISPDQAVDELLAAGKVSTLAQIASLDLALQLADARAVRLQRETLRTATQYGADSEEAIEAEERIGPHVSYQRALRVERDRAAVPIPPAPASGGLIYGRVFTAAGKPAAKAVIEAVEARGDNVLGRAQTDAKGAYQIAVDAKAPADVRLRARAADSDSAMLIGDPFRLLERARVHRDLRLAAKGDSEPPPTPPPTPSATMPNLISMSEARARGVLEKLGVTKITVSTSQISTVPTGQVVKQAPDAGVAINPSTSVELVVSAAGDIVVPDLRRQTLEEATVTLNRVGLKVGEIGGERQNTVVTDQKPAPGQKVAPGTAVALKLAKPG